MAEALRKAFVTGGSGFVGQHLIAFLLQQGIIVRALARSDMAVQIIRELGAEVVQGDLDAEQVLVEAMTGCNVVFHVAAKTAAWGNYADFFQANVVGTEHVLAAARAAGVSRLVHVSTEAVLLGGRPIVDADETWPRASSPLGFYAATKALAEERVLQANSSGLACIIVRPRLVWGPGMPVLEQFSQIIRSGSYTWIEHGEYLTSTCHVSNLCMGMLQAAERGQGGEIYFLTDGAPVKFRTFGTALVQTRGLNPGNRSIPRWLARNIASGCEVIWQLFRLKGEPPLTSALVRLSGETVTVSDTKARRELGYTSSTTLEEGLAALTSLNQKLA